MMSTEPKESSGIRVMVVDDSAVIRAMITRRVSECPGLKVVTSLANGEMAVQYVRSNPVDVVILDIEMPVMDGLTALPKLLELSPATKVIMASALTLTNAEIGLRAMQMGATDYIPKPSSSRDKEAAEQFFTQLIAKIFAVSNQQPPRGEAAAAPAPRPARPVAALQPHPAADHLAPLPRIIYPTFAPQALAIASSTGGPQALIQLFKELKGHLERVPIFITQHMPATFTKILAQHLSQAIGRDCHEGVDGEVITPGKIYLAPGDYHMVPQLRKGQMVISINQEPEVNYCRPSADPMIGGLVDLFGNKLLLIVLTGMGQDGIGGARKLNERGGFIIAQDEATSVVWGMPKAIVENNLAKSVLPIDGFPAYLTKAFGERA